MNSVVKIFFSKLLVVFVLTSVFLAIGAFWPQIERNLFSAKELIFEHEQIASELNIKLKEATSLKEQKIKLQNEYDNTSSLWSPIAKSELYFKIQTVDAKISTLEKMTTELRAEKLHLERIIADSLPVKFQKQMENHGITILTTVVITVILLPILWPFLLFFVFGRLMEMLSKPKNSNNELMQDIEVNTADVRQTITIKAGEKLFLRSRDGDWLKERTNLKTRTKMVWSWLYPLLSYVANLVELIVCTPCNEHDGEAVIVAPMSDTFLIKLELGEDQELIIRPRYLVGLTSGVQIKARWNWRLHHLLSGRFRQIILYGQGSVLLAGGWGINVKRVDKNRQDVIRMEENLLLAYGANSEFKLCRTETFWSYFRGRTALFDYQLDNGLFVVQNNPNILKGKKTGTLSSFGSGFLNMLGRLLGF